jgi:hypothetical protein
MDAMFVLIGDRKFKNTTVRTVYTALRARHIHVIEWS